ncbi:AAA family ATPase [Xanthomonas hyacinthi]|uniref:AAA family ATPase n=1 Tax=Xanthomonas hyacinthi TaxID=56455 RepID=A0A2S7EUD2_9XANT|nr:AAA family ATPase [Xanthomonas hyacinthi]KLD78162.1 ATPase AAA [Xanthomonas hyacinthi DSM 19077]PPU96743.1 AAA family ATPase [Xanthomonas hyacinthi]QGY76311.1 AAA family ATPase [Xanthomonas hyacinthi]
MIESMQIAGVASYGQEAQALDGLTKFNFLYGANGCGKTTISRVIADPAGYPGCHIGWKNGTPLQVMVYNRDFVARNFGPSVELKGIFTLGAKNVDNIAKIVALKQESDSYSGRIANLKETLEGLDGQGGKRKELADLETQFQEACWAQKRKYDSEFALAFQGVRNNAENFKARVLLEHAGNSAALVPLADLHEKAKTIFGPSPAPESLVVSPSFDALLFHESNPILSKRVLGREDVDIAAMIKALGNSDWVRQGRAYFDEAASICPFCQQTTEASFAASLEAYFDGTFLAASHAIDDLAKAYAASADYLLAQLSATLDAPCRFLDAELLRTEVALLASRIALNRQHLADKQREPSQLVALEPLADTLERISQALVAANEQIEAHNATVANLGKEKRQLANQVWKHIIAVELATALQDYSTRKQGLTGAIMALTGKIEVAEIDRRQKQKEIAELERATTSVQPTIDAINALLASFGFHGFSLGKADSGTAYVLRRPDGVDAKETLSEGERTFVTFLYFYHLLKGSDSESGVTTDRVVVFDDPVSSLDSDILFIVSSLIKALFDEVRQGIGHIKQVFVLTHNVYFHKEVTFNPRRTDRTAMRSEETFWVVRKSHHASRIEAHTNNPIVTSYELLWAEVRRGDRSNLSIQNTLRRILENYFKILGGTDTDDICNLFEGSEKVICRSLFSWVNDGSHFSHDDLYVAVDDAMVESYLRIFKAIFVKSRHLAHYKMMMREAYSDEPEIAPNAMERLEQANAAAVIHA